MLRSLIKNVSGQMMGGFFTFFLNLRIDWASLSGFKKKKNVLLIIVKVKLINSNYILVHE
jgi:hypothetical protein